MTAFAAYRIGLFPARIEEKNIQEKVSKTNKSGQNRDLNTGIDRKPMMGSL